MNKKGYQQTAFHRRELILSIVLLVLLAFFLSSCGGAEAPANEPADAGNEGPSEEVPGATPTPSPQDQIEAWVVDLEWPDEMALGESDVIRLAMAPSETGLVIEAEFADHRSVTREIPIQRPTGYLLIAAAEIHAPNFEVSPEGPQRRELIAGREERWHWTLAPLAGGRQRISFSINMEWQATEGQTPAVRRFGAFSQAFEVQVSSILGMSRSAAGKVLAAASLVILLAIGMAYRSAGLRQVIQTARPNLNVQLEALPDVSLSEPEKGLLQTAFRTYGRVVVEKEFMSGYSGARTFLVKPVRTDQKADARTIIKISDKESIRGEYTNYQKYVKNTLPPTTARIQQQPVARPNGMLAALQYTFIGMPGELPGSLRTQLLEDQDPDWFYHLADAYGPNWWMQRHPYTFRLAEEYDRKLPAHLVIQSARGEGMRLHADQAPTSLNAEVGDLVELVGFKVKSRRPGGGKISLVGTAGDGKAPVRVSYLGSTLPGRLVGTVVQTRSSFLAEMSAAYRVPGYPDPIEMLPDLLSEAVQGTRSIIHGDLNLENILIGPGDLLWLIDFSETREGHTLFDLAHLYAEVVAHVLARPDLLGEEYLKSIEGERYGLLSAVEQIARRYLFDLGDMREFYLAAVLSCLGALKYENLQPHAKRLLYLTAADITMNL